MPRPVLADVSTAELAAELRDRGWVVMLAESVARLRRDLAERSELAAGLGRLAGEDLPRAVAMVRDANAEAADLRLRTVAQQARLAELQGPGLVVVAAEDEHDLGDEQ